MSEEFKCVTKHINEMQEKFERRKYKFLIFYTMLCMTIILASGLMSYRLIEIYGYVAQAGQLVAPFWFLICDMIAEIYGFHMARQVVVCGFICQALFVLVCNGLIRLPHPFYWENQEAYVIVFGDMWRVIIAASFAFILAGFINVRLISYWRIITKGRYFWLRSIGASGVSELIFSAVATLFIQYGKQGIKTIFFMITASFVLKLFYSIILSIPANLIVNITKKLENTT